MKKKPSTLKARIIHESTPERLNAFSDGVFAIIITIMVLELKRPSSPAFSSLLEDWPTWISYIVSYIFTAVVWINHHFLLKYAEMVNLRLIYGNFAHLFAVSLIPFNTDWMAETRLAPVPVAMYGFVFLLVNFTYLLLARETINAKKGAATSTNRLFRVRSVISMLVFGTAMLVALWNPYIGFGIDCACLALYLRPDVPGMRA